MLLKILLFIIIFLIIENTIFQMSSDIKNKNIFEGVDKIILDSFINNRFRETLIWYEKYAFIYRGKFILYTTISLILSSSISIITLGEYTFEILGITDNKILIGWISTFLSIISGYLYFRNPKERWYNYRRTAEKLKEELSIKYATGQADKEFLLKIESHMKGEQNRWYSIKEKSKENGGK